MFSLHRYIYGCCYLASSNVPQYTLAAVELQHYKGKGGGNELNGKLHSKYILQAGSCSKGLIGYVSIAGSPPLKWHVKQIKTEAQTQHLLSPDKQENPVRSKFWGIDTHTKLT